MICPDCQALIPHDAQAALLMHDLDEAVLLMCGQCKSVSILLGGSLSTISEEFVAKLTEEQTEEMIQSIVEMRAHEDGAEAALEQLEKIRDDIKAKRKQ